MTNVLVTALWFFDRGTGVVSFPALWVAVLTGVFYRTRRPALFHDIAVRTHLKVSVFALIVLGMHAVVGTLDALALGANLAPMPNYPWWFFVVGTVIGAVALATILVAVVSFLAPWRFNNPSLVHSLAYLGFVFGAVHAVAIGTDIVGLAAQLVVVSLVVVAVALVVKLAVGVELGVRHVLRRFVE